MYKDMLPRVYELMKLYPRKTTDDVAVESIIAICKEHNRLPNGSNKEEKSLWTYLDRNKERLLTNYPELKAEYDKYYKRQTSEERYNIVASFIKSNGRRPIKADGEPFRHEKYLIYNCDDEYHDKMMVLVEDMKPKPKPKTPKVNPKPAPEAKAAKEKEAAEKKASAERAEAAKKEAAAREAAAKEAAAKAAADKAAQEAAAKAEAERLREISREDWKKAMKSLKIGNPAVITTQDGKTRSTISINGNIYGDGDLMSVTHEGIRFTWRVQGLSGGEKLRLERVRARRLKGSQESQKKK